MQSTTVLARTRRFLDWRACKPKVGLRTSSHTSVRLRCELATNPSWTMAAQALRERMAALARSEHERAARSLPAAALPQRAFSENTTKRDIPTFVRARIREFEAARECVVILAACLGVLFFESRRSSRWRGERADSHETHKKITKTKNTGREVVAHDARRERRLGLGHPLLLPAARPGGGLVRGGRKA